MVETSRLLMTIEKLLTFFEKNRFNLVTGPLLLLCFMVVRGYLEFAFFNRNMVTGLIEMNIYNVMAQGISMYLAFLAGTYILCVFSKEKPRKVANTILLGMSMIMVGPLIDRYIFGRAERYEFVWVDDFAGAGLGLVMQLMIIVTLGAVYVGVKTENVKRGVYTFFGLLAIMLAIGVPPYAVFKALDLVFSDDATQVTAIIMTILLILLFAIAILRIRKEDIYRALTANLKPKRTMFIVLVSLLGVIAAGRMLLIYSDEAVTIEVDDIPFAVLLLIAAAFAAQASLMLNDIFAPQPSGSNNPLVSRVLKRNQYIQLAVLMAIIAMALTLPMGVLPSLLMLLFLGLVITYNLSRSRFDNRIINHVLPGLQCATMFFIGYYSTRATTSYEILGFDLVYPLTPSLGVSLEALVVSVFIFITGMMLLARGASEDGTRTEHKEK